MGAPEGRPFTISEITARVKRLLEESFPQVWVVGEIGNLTRARSGHVYLTLKDESAALSAVIWRSTAARLRHELSEGQEVVARGRLVVYPPRGAYQLDIRVIEPRGVGALQLAFEKLRERLAAEGLFDEERKRPIPFLPGTIGIVTSPTGAAIRDILKVLSRRFPRVAVILAPARVQGKGAAEEIATGIRRLEARGDIDVVIVGRGGGSLEDLWAFNEEVVARAVAGCGIPVISAVGHEVDVTISDLAADLRAPTPSAAAERAVPDEAELRARLSGLDERMRSAVSSGLALRRERLRRILSTYALRGFPDRFRELSQRLDDFSRRASAAAAAVVARQREVLSDLAGRASTLNPLGVLARGYSVTTLGGRRAPLKDAALAPPGTVIETRLHRGGLRSRVVGPGKGGGTDG